jgi:hypothetical protein
MRPVARLRGVKRYAKPITWLPRHDVASQRSVLAVLAEGEYEVIKPCASDPQT